MLRGLRLDRDASKVFFGTALTPCFWRTKSE